MSGVGAKVNNGTQRGGRVYRERGMQDGIPIRYEAICISYASMETELLLLDNINSRGRVWGSVKGREWKAVITVVVVVVVVDGAMR